MWLWAALAGVLSRPADYSALRIPRSELLQGRLRPAIPHSAIHIPHSPQRVHHKRSEYITPFPPPSGWSGTTLVPPRYLPIPIEPPKSGLFNEASLFWRP